ncbi:MAG: FUSC family protein [Pseudoxanthomonas sp.]|nr:FUSC family protein [Pseudoxanthomonas sp.]
MSAPAPPLPPPGPDARTVLAEMRRIRPAPPLRTAFSLRAGLAMGVPILAGWYAGDPAAGMMATIGGFTALYCSGRPYYARGIALAVIACSFAGAVMFGLWLEHWPWLVVPVLALVAMLATWLCRSTRIGPPGAYLFVLACAAGTAMPARHLSPWHAGALILAGGAFAWLLHMAGALLWPRGPERRAVATAAKAVATWIATGDAAAHPPRRHAAQALHDSWQMLVGFQPIPSREHGELARLRALNRELHLLFASTLDPGLPPEHRDAALARARAITGEARQPPIRRPPSLPAGTVPQGYPRSWTLLREGLAPGSNARRVVLRVGLACLLAGTLAGLLEMERAYWAMAAALLMLHQGFDWPRTLQRSLERTLGTWVGLLLAGAILWLHPSGPWLALLVATLQFVIELVVVRNYAIAAIFITGAALTIASGGHAVDDIGGLLLARGLDTLLGCACALLAFRLLPPRTDARTVATGIGQCLLAIRETYALLLRGDVTSPAARAARRDLQHQSFLLDQALDEAIAGAEAGRRDVAAWWPAAATCQRLVYRLLGACWDMERRHQDGGSGGAAVPLAPAAPDAVRIDAALAAQAHAWRDLQSPPPLPPLPPLLDPDLADLRGFLVQLRNRPLSAPPASPDPPR